MKTKADDSSDSLAPLSDHTVIPPLKPEISRYTSGLFQPKQTATAELKRNRKFKLYIDVSVSKLKISYCRYTCKNVK